MALCGNGLGMVRLQNESGVGTIQVWIRYDAAMVWI